MPEIIQTLIRRSIIILVSGSSALILILLFANSTMNNPQSSSIQTLQTNTWSIVAVDPATGDVGVAGASCVPDLHADALAALVPGKGAAATQALWDLDNRNKVFELLEADISADDIIAQVTDPSHDVHAANRQYGVVTMKDGAVTIEAFTGSENLVWAGDVQNPDMNVTVQGNILVSEAVVTAALQAFTDDQPGVNTLPDRLMRALEAGSTAGGDSRCNNDEVEQTAATAFIAVTRGGDAPYATRRIGITDMGTDEAPWLALSVAEPQFGPNPLVELRTLYDQWRQGNPPPVKRSVANPLIYIAIVVIVLLLILIGWIWLTRKSSKHKHLSD